MENHQKKLNKGEAMRYIFTGLLGILFLVVSCRSSQNYQYTSVCEYKSQQETNKIANETYLYALMSANSYNKQERTPWILPKNIKEIKNTELALSSCKIREKKDELGTGVFNLGKGAQAKVFEVKNDKSDLAQVVIAFRGTQGFFDWIFGNFSKTQRKKALLFYDELAKYYQDRNKNVKIVVTGHSLGGAMSLHVSSERGADAYVFNSSYRVKNKNPKNAKRILVEEKGDILAVHRCLWKNPCDIERHKVEGTMKDNHSMVKLSEYLLRMASNNNKKAKEICIDNGLVF